MKIRARVSRRAKQASRSKTGSNGLEQKSAFPWSFGTVFCPISVNPKDERVFTREAGKKLYQRTKGKPCKKSFADELSAQSRSVQSLLFLVLMQRLQKLEIWLDDNLAGVRRRKKAEAAYYWAHVSKWGLVCLRWCGFYPPVGACSSA